MTSGISWIIKDQTWQAINGILDLHADDDHDHSSDHDHHRNCLCKTLSCQNQPHLWLSYPHVHEEHGHLEVCPSGIFTIMVSMRHCAAAGNDDLHALFYRQKYRCDQLWRSLDHHDSAFCHDPDDTCNRACIASAFP